MFFSKRLFLSVFLVSVFLLVTNFVLPWGFYTHRKINRLAIFSLPPEMLGFYKKNAEFITENAVNPDQRRYAVEDEAARHYIDLDVYADSVKQKLPFLTWKQAVEQFSEDTLKAYGIVPWHIVEMKFRLEKAFREKDTRKILQLSADLGHYIADANVPLHTTQNYNGHLTNQRGIHAFWESRIPELFSNDFDLLVGQATYIEFPRKRAWDAVLQAHAALDSVLLFEKELTQKMSDDKKYTIEERNGQMMKNYSKEFSERYNTMLDRQVERQLRASIKMVADFWFTAWVDAGQPDLMQFTPYIATESDHETEKNEKKAWLQKILQRREEADF
jgi:hypothetical protein